MMKLMKFRLAVFIFAIFYAALLNANDIDNLLAKADSIRSSHPELFTSIINDLEPQQNNFTTAQTGYFQYLLAYKKSFEGDFPTAIKLYNAIINNQEHDKLLHFRANMSLVNIYVITKEWNEGLNHLLINQQLLPSLPDSEIKQLGTIINALFYTQLEQFELAIQYAEPLLATLPQGRNLCAAHQLVLEAKYKLNQLSLNAPELEHAIAACQFAQENVALSAIYTNYADMLLKQNQYTEALTLLSTHEQLVFSTKYPPYIAFFVSLRAQAHLALGDIEKAKEDSLKTLEYSASLNGSEPIIIANQVLYSLAELEGDHQAALSFYKAYSLADKAYLNNIRAKHLAFQLAQHKAREQQSQINFLQQQNNLLTLKEKFNKVEQENSRLFISLLIVCVTMLIGFIVKSKSTQRTLRRLAQNDGLTGLYNRRHFTLEASRAIVECDKASQLASCILFDLDKFKLINDSYGHACGDWVLKQVADVCKRHVRKDDILARIGGEEFCVFLPRCDADTAKAIAEEYRQLINQIDTKDSGFDFTISASFGVTDFSLSGIKLDKLIAHADEAMYRAKKSGRNKVIIYHAKKDKTASQTQTESLNLA